VKYILIFISSSCFGQLSGSVNTIYATQAFYGFDIRYKVKEGVQEVHYIAGYGTNANSDMLSFSAGGRHGLKYYWGAQFSFSLYKFDNTQKVVTFDPLIGYRFKRIFIESGARLRLQYFGPPSGVRHSPFLTIGLK
jgi:hypothetical protein